MDGHLSSQVAANGAAVFIEVEALVGGVRLGFAAKNHSSSVGHGVGGTLQDHSPIFKNRKMFVVTKLRTISAGFQCCATYQ